MKLPILRQRDSLLGLQGKQLIPCVLREAFLQPDEVRSVFATLPDAARHPLACGALEPALWDLYGKNMGCSMTTLIGAKDTWDVRGSARQLPASGRAKRRDPAELLL